MNAFVFTFSMRHKQIKNKLFKQNRTRLAELMEGGALAIVNANDVLPISADAVLPMQPSPDLFYLSGIEQEESVLLLFPDAIDPKNREILFLRQPSEHLKIWEGYKHSKEDATKISGIENVKWLSDLPGQLHLLMCECDSVYLNSNEHNRAVVEVETRDMRFARQCQRQYPLHQYRRLAPLLHRLRSVKSKDEQDLLRKAVEITEKGFRRILQFVKPGVTEYEVEAELIHEYTRNRGKFAYNPIVASGVNACTLHYVQNDQTCRKGQMLLLDVASSYANYSADLTRTIPVSGKFTRRQKAVYKAVLRILRASIEGATIGKKHSDWQKEAQAMMTDELLALGLLKPKDVKKQDPDNPACRKYYMHGLGHPLGLDVHDVARAQDTFDEGWCLTVEPGIYIPEEGFAVRLEDDIIVTKDGPINLMETTPIEPDEIEELMNS